MSATTTPKIEINEKVKNWFDDLVGNIRVDQLMIETETAPAEKDKFYKSLIFGEEIELVTMSRIQSSMYFIKRLVWDYVSELRKFQAKPYKIALDLSDAKILVWAEIEDGDDATEDALILSEAKANAKYSEYGFHVTSTIVEKRDGMEIPPHYQSLSI